MIPRITIFLLLGVVACTQVDKAYLDDLLKWKTERRLKLEADDGYLSLAGIFWLDSGQNHYGSEEKIRFPEGVPSFLGSYLLKDDSVWHQAEGEPTLAYPYPTGSAVTRSYQSYTWYVIKRGEAYAVRLKNAESDERKNFGALNYFPVNADWNTIATFEPYESPKEIQIENIVGFVTESKSPGKLTFSVKGKEYSLDVLEEGDRFFIIFGDKTNGETTYGGGRYLYTMQPDENGLVALDFNKSYNPPCVFTAYATCPLPPKQNILPVEVRAGEKLYDLAL